MPVNGICERFHKTLLDEFYRVAFRKKVYETADTLQADTVRLRDVSFNCAAEDHLLFGPV